MQSLAADLTGFSDHLRARGRSPRTISAYLSDLRAWAALVGDVAPAQVRRQDLDRHLATMRTAGLGAGTLRRRVAALAGYYRWLNYADVTDHDPTRGLALPPITHGLPHVLSEEQVRALCAVPELPGLVVSTLYATGARASELAGATAGDLLPDGLRVVGKGDREAVLVLPPALATRLGLLTVGRDPGTPLLARAGGLPLGRGGIYRAVRRAGRALHIQCHPHMLRHAAATHLLAHGCELRLVQEFLRHASISTTTIYTHVTGLQVREAAARHHPGHFGSTVA